MSLSYALLNLPYFISWFVFFYHMAFLRAELTSERRHNLFAFSNLTEIFYVLNYGVHFFIYAASGQKFRDQLRDAFHLTRNWDAVREILNVRPRMNKNEQF